MLLFFMMFGSQGGLFSLASVLTGPTRAPPLPASEPAPPAPPDIQRRSTKPGRASSRKIASNSGASAAAAAPSM